MDLLDLLIVFCWVRMQSGFSVAIIELYLLVILALYRRPRYWLTFLVLKQTHEIKLQNQDFFTLVLSSNNLAISVIIKWNSNWKRVNACFDYLKKYLIKSFNFSIPNDTHWAVIYPRNLPRIFGTEAPINGDFSTSKDFVSNELSHKVIDCGLVWSRCEFGSRSWNGFCKMHKGRFIRL